MRASGCCAAKHGERVCKPFDGCKHYLHDLLPFLVAAYGILMGTSPALHTRTLVHESFEHMYAQAAADQGRGVHCFIVPTDDDHMSEYSPDCFKRREWVSRCVCVCVCCSSSFAKQIHSDVSYRKRH
jgi:hypothetical protein